MRRYLIVVATAVAFGLAASASVAQQCPVTDVRAALAQACPCASAGNPGQFAKCVRSTLKDLHAKGCDVSAAMRCAKMSTCGRPHSPVVCCNRKGHAQILPAAKCSARGGKVATGVTSVCDAVCTTATP